MHEWLIKSILSLSLDGLEELRVSVKCGKRVITMRGKGFVISIPDDAVLKMFLLELVGKLRPDHITYCISEDRKLANVVTKMEPRRVLEELSNLYRTFGDILAGLHVKCMDGLRVRSQIIVMPEGRCVVVSQGGGMTVFYLSNIERSPRETLLS